MNTSVSLFQGIRPDAWFPVLEVSGTDVAKAHAWATDIAAASGCDLVVHIVADLFFFLVYDAEENIKRVKSIAEADWRAKRHPGHVWFFNCAAPAADTTLPAQSDAHAA